jgi:hypothetical protein
MFETEIRIFCFLVTSRSKKKDRRAIFSRNVYEAFVFRVGGGSCGACWLHSFLLLSRLAFPSCEEEVVAVLDNGTSFNICTIFICDKSDCSISDMFFVFLRGAAGESGGGVKGRRNNSGCSACTTGHSILNGSEAVVEGCEQTVDTKRQSLERNALPTRVTYHFSCSQYSPRLLSPSSPPSYL